MAARCVRTCAEVVGGYYVLLRECRKNEDTVGYYFEARPSKKLNVNNQYGGKMWQNLCRGGWRPWRKEFQRRFPASRVRNLTKTTNMAARCAKTCAEVVGGPTMVSRRPDISEAYFDDTFNEWRPWRILSGPTTISGLNPDHLRVFMIVPTLTPWQQASCRRFQRPRRGCLAS